jgi:hypothetical protein
MTQAAEQHPPVPINVVFYNATNCAVVISGQDEKSHNAFHTTVIDPGMEANAGLVVDPTAQPFGITIDSSGEYNLGDTCYDKSDREKPTFCNFTQVTQKTKLDVMLIPDGSMDEYFYANNGNCFH